MNEFHVAEVSVIIVNYNGEDVLEDAIGSVLELSLSPLEVVVLDNGSSDRSLAIIQTYAERDQRVKPILAGTNLGVAGGRNLAVSYANGRLLAFLDADGRAGESWLPAAVAAFNQVPQIGAVAPLVLMREGKIINGAGSYLDADGHGRDALYGEALLGQREALESRKGLVVDYPMGCGMIVRLPGLEDVWPLDERLPKWHDDSEIGVRVRRLGYKTIFWPESEVFHLGGHSDPKSHYDRHWLGEEARIRMLIKYYSWTRVMKNIVSLWLHGLTGTRRRPEMWQEVRTVMRNIRRHFQELIEIRREWLRPK